MAIKTSATTKNIDKVIQRAREKYSEVMASEHIGVDIKINGVVSKGQVEDNQRRTSLKEQQTKTMTCMLDTPVKRGYLIEMKADLDDEDYSIKGIVASIPTRTPVDWYFYALMFNTTVERRRNKIIYEPNGDIREVVPEVVDTIPAFVQRVGMRERQIDMGIDRDSVNQIITTTDCNIKKNDILYIGTDSYKITDIEELEKDIFSAFMTYYRE